MTPKYYYLFILFVLFGFTLEDNASKHQIKMFHLYIPDRDLRSQTRILKQENKSISTIYTKGSPETYRLVINKNEVNEGIFTLEHFISTNFMDMPDAIRHYQIYNQETFIIYHNQNGFYPVSGNEYYLVNESKNKIYEIIADGHIHNLKEPDDKNYNKLIDILCQYKNKIYTIPHEMCN